MSLPSFPATYGSLLLFLKNPFYAVLVPVDTKKVEKKNPKEKIEEHC